MYEIEIEYKLCSRCQSVKPVSEFSFRHRATGTRHSYCRDCGKKFSHNHYKREKRSYLDRNVRAHAKRREIVRQAKSRPCADCSIQYPYYVMDFDHRDGKTKMFALNKVDRMTENAVRLEIEKCDVVCSNFHRERTHRRRMHTST